MTFFYYFAYGSNLLKQRIRVQNKGAEYVINGVLDGFKLHFVSFSKRWHGGLATVIQENDSKVIGCVWKVPMEFSNELDKQETGYHRLTVPIKCDNGEIIDCRTYQFSDLTALESPPSPHYKTVILAGAVEHQMPHDYIQKLYSISDNGYKGRVEVDVDVIHHLNAEAKE